MMSINMGAMLLLAAILSASLATAARPSHDQKILILVEKPLSPFPGGAAGREYGKPLTLPQQRRPVGLGDYTCSKPGEECNYNEDIWCCGSLECSSSTSAGTCSQMWKCIAPGGFCSGETIACCYPSSCRGEMWAGTCVNQTYAA